MVEESKPPGAVLAGGAGERLGGAKATAELGGRPLIAYPLAAFESAGIEAFVVAKPDTELPDLDFPVLTEPGEPHHPILGLVTALENAGGRPVVTCPCDTPFVTSTLLTQLAAAPTTAAVHDGERLHPLLARFQPDDLPFLQEALEAGRSATATVEALLPLRIDASPETTFNVNTAADLERAASIFSQR